MNYKKIAKEAIKQVFDLLQTRRLQLVGITNAQTLGTDERGNVVSTSGGGYIELVESIELSIEHIGKTLVIPPTLTGQTIYITINDENNDLMPIGSKVKVIIMNSTNQVYFGNIDGITNVDIQARGGFLPGLNYIHNVSMTAEKITSTTWLVESPFLHYAP